MSCFKKCLKVEEGSDAAEHIDNATEWIFSEAAKFLRSRAESQGIAIPDTLEDKLYRYGIKNGLLPMREQDELYYAHKVNLKHD